MNTPRVSVLTTVYNGQKYIQQTVRSILDQTLTDFEYIIIDDGSTDATADLLDQLARHDPRLRVFHEPNRGVTPAANFGLSLCQTPYIARIDGDDLAKPQRLARQLAFLQADDAVCVGSDVELIDARGRYLTTLHTPTGNDEIQRQILAGHGAIFHPACMIRRSALDAVGGYDEDFDTALDLDLWLRLGEVGRLHNLPLPLLQYRLHPESVSETRGETQRHEAREACRRACRRRGVHVEFQAEQRWRPDRSRRSRHHFALTYGWWAFNSGQRRTALVYASKALHARPLHPAGWDLLACAALKRLPAVTQPT